MGMINWLFNRKNIKNPAKLSWRNIKKFLQGNFYVIAYKIPFLRSRFIDESREEQYQWRYQQVAENSFDCILKGECYCGCDLEGLIMSDAPCQEEPACYPAMMKKAEWEKYKKDNKIILI